MLAVQDLSFSFAQFVCVWSRSMKRRVFVPVALAFVVVIVIVVGIVPFEELVFDVAWG